VDEVYAYVVDPVSVSEFEHLAWYSGHPDIRRKSLSHALNIHAIARRAAQRIGKNLDETNLVVAHLGGGISIAPVKAGKIIDANDAISDGPFSPERTGGLPLQQFITVCFSGKYQESEIRSIVMGKGGLFAYLGTTDANDVERRIGNGDPYAVEVYEAMSYQIAKEIGAMATVLKGNLDAIVLTGGLAYSKLLTDWITDRVSFIAKVVLIPGEDEMKSMAEGALRVLRGEEQVMTY
jgi:butyrate kinase